MAVWCLLIYFLLFFPAEMLQKNMEEQLHTKCLSDKDCQDAVQRRCVSGICACEPFSIQYNISQCLPSRLLGQECLIPEQCTMKVAKSTCSHGKCKCSDGYLKFRTHTCLSAAKPGEVCFNNEHCKLWTKHSHCQFLIPNLIGKCSCNSHAKHRGNSCFMEENAVIPKDHTTEPVKVISADTKFSENPQKTNQKNEVSETDDNSNDNVFPYKVKVQEEDPTASDPFYDQRKHVQGTNNGEVVPVHSATSDSPTFPTNSSNYKESWKEINHLVSEDVKSAEPLHVPAYLKYIEKTEKISLGLPCISHKQCQAADAGSRCMNNVCECLAKGNGTEPCKGCSNETFQCRSSGICISWYFVCDGKKDCSDGSDEECAGPVCPKQAFQCGESGICVSRAVICDGSRNCPNGEDEIFCKTQGPCPDGSFRCKNGQCLPGYEFCNARPACSDKSDELEEVCGSMMPEGEQALISNETCPFRCKNGRCRSTAILCSGRDGCGDYSDEWQCTVCRCPSIQ